MTPAMTPPPTLPLAGHPLGRFPVHVDAEALAGFRAAIGETMGPAVPLTFAMRWLAGDAVRSAVIARLAATGAEFALVHLGQAFRHHKPLEPGQSYELVLAVEGPDARGQVWLRGQVLDMPEPALMLELESQLFLHPVENAA